MMNSIISKVKITNLDLNKLIVKNRYLTKQVYEVLEIHPPVCPVCNACSMSPSLPPPE